MIIDNDAFIDAVDRAAADDNMVKHIATIAPTIGTTQDCLNDLNAAQGAATSSLMDCLAEFAKYHSTYGGRPITPQTFVLKNGELCEIECGAEPVFEITVMRDTISPFSFFVRGEYVDPRTRAPVKLFDSIWCLFDKEKYTTEQLEGATPSDMTQYIADGECETTVNLDNIDYSKYIVRRVDYPRLDLTGGIVYHKTYINGKEMSFGKWQVHT